MSGGSGQPSPGTCGMRVPLRAGPGGLTPTPMSLGKRRPESSCFSCFGFPVSRAGYIFVLLQLAAIIIQMYEQKSFSTFKIRPQI